MKTGKLFLGLILILFLSQLMLSSLFSQTITETFATNNFPASPAGNGSFVGVNGTLWNYTLLRYGSVSYPARYEIGGTLSSLFTKKIANVTITANGWSSTIPSVFDICINNTSVGTFSFLSGGGTQSVTLTSGCDTSELTIRMVSAWYNGAIKTVSVTFDTLLPDAPVCSSPYIKYVHSTFTNDPKTQMTISWSSPITDTGSYVVYGTNTAYGSVSSNQSERLVLADASNDTLVVHHVTLTGLTPGTKYHYRCGGNSGLSGDCSFRTAPAGIEPFTFAVLGDVQSAGHSSSTYNCAVFLKEQDVDFVIQVADIVQQGCHLNQWKALFESGKTMFESAPLMGCLGTNHDVGYEASCGTVPEFVHSLFKFPENNSPAHQNLWYSFEYSNSLFAFMRYPDLSYKALMMQYMDSVFSNTSSPWKFATWHTNVYSTSGHGGDDLNTYLPNCLALADTYNIAAVFDGHGHGYEFTHPINKVGNPPVISKASVDWNNRTAMANFSQGTVYYTGAGIQGGATMGTYYAHGLPVNFTLTGDSAGGDKNLLLATVYNDSIVYKVVYFEDCKTYKKGDVLFTYKIVNDNPGTQYALTVNGGSGSGNYNASTPVVITANAPAPGKVFDKWTGNVANVANINAASTTITMPAANTVITATYKDAPATYTLTVTGGTGSGSYTAGTVVDISANAPAVGKAFDKWTGDVTGIADVNLSSTTITMPSSNAAITATYRDVTPADTFVLIVVNGTGSGNYTAGTVVNISANTPPSGKEFDLWKGDTAGVADLNSAATTITMPSANTGVAAYYKDIENTLDNEKNGIKIYPNPVSDILNIEVDGTGESIIRIADMTGKAILVIKSNEAGKLEIPVGHLSGGIYIIEVLRNNTIDYLKFSKQ